MDIKALQEERKENIFNIYHSRIPRRVPVNVSVGFEAVAQFGGVDIVKAQWNPALVADAADKLCQVLYSDTCPASGSIRFPSYYTILQSQSYKMGANGFIQHPDVTGMLPEDYDYLIENPYECLLERVIPRHHKALNLNNPVQMAIQLTKAILNFNAESAAHGQISAALTEKYGYFAAGMMASGGMTSAPFDFLADMLRSFSGISKDVRRMPEKVEQACDALYPLLFKKGLPPVITEGISTVGNPLHMPTFMRDKDFAKLWWPTMKQQADEYASLGVRMSLFCEDDWTRYLDYLYELPTNTILMFEYGDPKLIKEKLGKKHIITGLYPLTLLKTGTKQQCIDKAKELVDILAPGGKYMFALDKGPLTLNDINMENLCAVTEFVRDYAVYANPGEVSGLEFCKEDYKVPPSRSFSSKYYQTWEQYKALHPEISPWGESKLQSLEELMFHHLLFLLV